MEYRPNPAVLTTTEAASSRDVGSSRTSGGGGVDSGGRKGKPAGMGGPENTKFKYRGVRQRLGYFAIAEDAARAYDRAALLLLGPRAHLNFTAPPPLPPVAHSHPRPSGSSPSSSTSACARVANLAQRPQGAVQPDETETAMVTQLLPVPHTLNTVTTNRANALNGVTDGGQPMPQVLSEEDLDDVEVDGDLQAPISKEPSNSRSEEPSNSRRVDGGTHGRPKKRKDGSVPCLEETMSAYVDLKGAQSSLKEQAIAQGQECSMSRCFEVLHSMNDVSDEIMVLASDVFKDPVNREIFMCYEPRLRGLWLRKEVAKLDVPGFSL